MNQQIIRYTADLISDPEEYTGEVVVVQNYMLPKAYKKMYQNNPENIKEYIRKKLSDEVFREHRTNAFKLRDHYLRCLSPCVDLNDYKDLTAQFDRLINSLQFPQNPCPFIEIK